ncbi:LysM peptidoglycan-binding domain-containing protein [Rheinheimera salexigens]|uniref:Lytic transglycosylase n=1 Tax=Rheinheimera salexigens TaxID=1628148 RepID=A0A1E7Q5G6_9GAMM|nr:LysM peptidoglycan-binding domain-containing protein [Rheinheimera salexigens]OEY69298.1 lytic transglycosylase [Rheinheimera salexigens]
MFKKFSALAGIVILTGCVSQNASENNTDNTAPTVNTVKKKPAADFFRHAASAEQIAEQLWLSGVPPDSNQLDAAELEDLWQRIQYQLSFEVPQTRPIVEQRNLYTASQTYLDRISTRAQPFLYYIVQELEKRNMPLELALLPIVESAFDPYAYSHASAAGMWQFMPATGKRFGLKQNFWYDGRNDVITSTNAALDYLKYLHDTLEGDWLNAIAAYNSGEGRIMRAIKLNKKRRLPTDFWSLDLPAETTAYVPKLLALVDILKRPDDFDVVWKFIANEPKLSLVEVDNQIDLTIAAKMAGISVAELQALNPGFKQWATDPEGPHALVLPIAAEQQFQSQLAQTPERDWLRWQRYTVVKGDTLGKIAQQHNTAVNAIQRINKLSNNTIRLGQHLLIPSTAEGDVNSSIAKASQLNDRANAHTIDQPNISKKTQYTIKHGDTLWDLSREYKVSVDDIAKWNGINKNAGLKLGQKIVIMQNAADIESVTRTLTYKVRQGDSLARIAQRFSITVADIVKWNQINKSNFIQPGQKLKLVVDVTQV